MLAHMRTSEGFKPNVYDDAGKPAIGYGHDLRAGESFPTGITEPQARALQKLDVEYAEAAIKSLVKVPLTQGQFDALVDFAYNVGTGQKGFGGSTLLKFLNLGKYAAAGQQLLRWDFVKGKENDGLEARRKEELVFWNS